MIVDISAFKSLTQCPGGPVLSGTGVLASQVLLDVADRHDVYYIADSYGICVSKVTGFLKELAAALEPHP